MHGAEADVVGPGGGVCLHLPLRVHHPRLAGDGSVSTDGEEEVLVSISVIIVIIIIGEKKTLFSRSWCVQGLISG